MRKGDKRLSGDQIELIHRLFRDGYSYMYIAESVGCSRDTVSRHTRGLAKGRKPRSSYKVDKIRENQLSYNNKSMYNLQDELSSLEIELSYLSARITEVYRRLKHLNRGEK